MASHVESQIVASYEDHGVTIEEIAANFGFSEEAVKILLGAKSSVYRAQVKAEVIPDVTDDDFDQVKAVMKSLLLSDQPNVQLKAARFLWDEKKNRNDPAATKASMLNGAVININVINEQMQKARVAVERAKTKATQAPVLIEA